jgi:hypothetical protein
LAAKLLLSTSGKADKEIAAEIAGNERVRPQGRLGSSRLCKRMAMKIKIGLWFTALCALCQGCSPLANVARALVIEPIEYCRGLDNCADLKQGYALASGAWNEFRATCPDVAFSESFEKGFKDGFADYLYAGGTGNPPPVPPRCYWKHKYETPEGHKFIDDWFAGFRAGASSAQASGMRRFVTIPASTALPRKMSRMDSTPVTEPSKQEALPVPKEALPVPKEMP